MPVLLPLLMKPIFETSETSFVKGVLPDSRNLTRPCKWQAGHAVSLIKPSSLLSGAIPWPSTCSQSVISLQPTHLSLWFSDFLHMWPWSQQPDVSLEYVPASRRFPPLTFCSLPLPRACPLLIVVTQVRDTWDLCAMLSYQKALRCTHWSVLEYKEVLWLLSRGHLYKRNCF